MHKHLGHAQRIGHQTSVLPACAAKALQGVARHVVATCHRYFFDGIGHLLHGDLNKPIGHFFSGTFHLPGQHRKLLLHRLRIQGLVGTRAKHPGKEIGLHLAHHHIGIGHRQGAATAVAGRPRVRACALRPDAQTCAVKQQQGAAPGRHGVNAHHRRAHAHTGHLGFKLALEHTRVVRHIGRGAAHVKTNHFVVPGLLGGARHAHYAACRATQNRVFAGKGLGVRQSAGRLHEHQTHARHVAGHLVHITLQDGRQIRVHHRGVTAADELHQGAGAVRGADLAKAHLLRQTRGRLLVGGEAVTVHEHNRHTAQPLIKLGLQLPTQMRFVQNLHHVTMRAHAFIRLHHRLVQEFGQDNLPVKQSGAVLVGNAQGIGKACRGHQQCGLALALQQRVGGHGGAHLYALDHFGRDRGAGRQAQQLPNAGDCRIAVLLGVFGQQLECDQAAIRALADHVSERAATVNPKLPARQGCLGGVGREGRFVHIFNFQKEAAARAAWSYMPESTRSRRAKSPMSLFKALSACKASIKQDSRISR